MTSHREQHLNLTPSFMFSPFDIHDVSPAVLNDLGHQKLALPSETRRRTALPYPIWTILIAPAKRITLEDRQPKPLQTPLAVIYKRRAIPGLRYSTVLDVRLQMAMLPLRATTCLRLGVASPNAAAALQILGVWRRNAFAIPHLIGIHEFPRRRTFVGDVIDDRYGRGIVVVVHGFVDHGFEQHTCLRRVSVRRR
jgi:hypothetical protein